MTQAIPILELVRNASAAEKDAILDALLRERTSLPTNTHALTPDAPQPIAVQFTEDDVKEMNRRLDCWQDSLDAEEVIERN